MTAGSKKSCVPASANNEYTKQSTDKKAFAARHDKTWSRPPSSTRTRTRQRRVNPTGPTRLRELSTKTALRRAFGATFNYATITLPRVFPMRRHFQLFDKISSEL